jgi:hypothetical protein
MDIKILHFKVTGTMHWAIKRAAAELNMTMQDFVVMLLEEGIRGKDFTNKLAGGVENGFAFKDPANPGYKIKRPFEVKPGNSRQLEDDEIIGLHETPIEGMKTAKIVGPKKFTAEPSAISNQPGPDLCPHGFAKGFCKRADCNRKYQK